MPDISMCQNESCASRKRCYRYMAIPHENWQTFGSFAPQPGDTKCEYFASIWPTSRIRKEEDRP